MWKLHSILPDHKISPTFYLHFFQGEWCYSFSSGKKPSFVSKNNAIILISRKHFLILMLIFLYLQPTAGTEYKNVILFYLLVMRQFGVLFPLTYLVGLHRSDQLHCLLLFLALNLGVFLSFFSSLDIVTKFCLDGFYSGVCSTIWT